MFLLHGFFAFIVAISFGIIFSVPRKALLLCGVSGTMAWWWFLIIKHLTGSNIAGNLAGGVAVAIVSEIAARLKKQPVTLFAVPGIVVLVPGFVAYNAMLSFMEGKYIEGLRLGTETLFLAGAITVGIILVGGWVNLTRKSAKKG